MNELIAVINDRLARGESLAVATIVTNEGSTPRTAGSKMLVFADGSIAGTVGGGLGEGMVITAAKETLAIGESRLMGIDMTGQAAAGADLICGGRMRVFLERIEADAVGQELFATLAGSLAAGRSALLLTRVGGEAWGGTRCLLTPDGVVAGALLRRYCLRPTAASGCWSRCWPWTRSTSSAAAMCRAPPAIWRPWWALP
jgi:xanthine dehydrogenase accessory factor